MILQALNQYYERMATAHPGELSEFGFERKPIPVIIELTDQGSIHQINIDKDKNSTTTYILPKAVKKTSGIAANFFWDNAEYALGLTRPSGKPKPGRVAQQHQAFIDRIHNLNVVDPGVDTLKNFLNTLDLTRLQQRSDFDTDFFQTNPNVSFKLASDTCLICERPAIRQAIQSTMGMVQTTTGLCLITGDSTPPERLHPAITGVWYARPSGANIISFNRPAFTSFNKKQGDNAPVGSRAAFNYTESLNHLLRKGSRQRTQIGDASTVFWSETGIVEIENAFHTLMVMPEKAADDPNRNAAKVKAALQAFHTGSRIPEEDNQRFFVLGLAPNASRIAIRFWKVSTIKQISANICQHFEDIRICHPAQKYAEIPLPHLLRHLCLKYKLSNLPPNLSGEVVRSILDNSPYPYTLLAAAVRRNKAKQKVSFPRAAIIKACLNRQIRQSRLTMQEFTMALDLSNTDVPYLLGRWFASLEKIQEEANPGINATIKDRYYGAVSSNPISVFGILDRLKNHHLRKLETSHRINKERLLGQIIDQLPARLPNHFSLQDQGCFAIGYYHQRQDFFKPKDKQPTQSSNPEPGAQS